MAGTLKVNEIFYSIQGESTWTGLPFTLVRLAGCNLRCRWCDTPAARSDSGAERMSVGAVLEAVNDLGCPRVLVTGGEPLIQPAAGQLLGRLCDAGRRVLLETNGSQDISAVDARVGRIVDVKCPSSGAAEAMRWDNLEALTAGDEVKFVIADADDYAYACEVVGRCDLARRAAVTFSPVAGELRPAELADWMLADRLDVRLGLQLHRILWPGRTRGV